MLCERNHQMRFEDLFTLFAGFQCLLDRDSLRDLLEHVLPVVTDAQLRYLQVVLDYDNDSFISLNDLRMAVNDCVEVGRALPVQDRVEVEDVLLRIGSEIRHKMVSAIAISNAACLGLDPFSSGAHIWRKLRTYVHAIFKHVTNSIINMRWVTTTWYILLQDSENMIMLFAAGAAQGAVRRARLQRRWLAAACRVGGPLQAIPADRHHCRDALYHGPHVRCENRR